MTGKRMPTDKDIQRLQKLAEDFDPATTPSRDAGDLRAIAETVDGIHASEAKLRELVELARGRGRSWGEIAIALGVSRQAAHERFADKVRV
jgi:DNA-directed RNA polymerase specialized sigma24 family protein